MTMDFDAPMTMNMTMNMKTIIATFKLIAFALVFIPMVIFIGLANMIRDLIEGDEDEE